MFYVCCMHIGDHYGFWQVVVWTRRDLLGLFCFNLIFPILHQHWELTFLQIPWLPVALIGTAVAFVVGFKNNASYDRMWEARRSWGSIINASRSFALLCKNSIEDPILVEEIMNRHFGWLTALRFQLRSHKPWETTTAKNNQEFRAKFYHVEEQDKPIEEVIHSYIPKANWEKMAHIHNKAAFLLSQQGNSIKEAVKKEKLHLLQSIEIEKLLIEFYNQQGVCERIKNTPYPRQYATLNLYFIRIFVFLLPLGMMPEFDKVGNHFIWLTIPFCTLISWVFTTMEKIGTATENPFEGGSNDIAITSICRNIEIEIKQTLNLQNIPEVVQAENNILM